MKYKPLMMMRTRGISSPVATKTAKLTKTVAKSKGNYIVYKANNP